MAQKMQSDWVVPILEDLREFARANSLSAFADDLESVLHRHADELRDPKPMRPSKAAAARMPSEVVKFQRVTDTRGV